MSKFGSKEERLVRQAVLVAVGQAAQHIKTSIIETPGAGSVIAHVHEKEAEEIEDWCVAQIMAIFNRGKK